jgi:hypothetical protein
MKPASLELDLRVMVFVSGCITREKLPDVSKYRGKRSGPGSASDRSIRESDRVATLFT